MTGSGARTRMLAEVAAGRTPQGLFVGSTDPAMTDIVAAAGFDFAVFDAEHGPLDPVLVLNHVRAAEAGGMMKFVRIPENSQPVFQKYLDVGCEGFVVPHVDTAAQAERAVAATRFAPRGNRGMCPSCHAAGYSMEGWKAFAARSSEDVMVVPIIESAAAVENIDEIYAVDGIDIVLFGPGDLSQDLGLDMSDPRIGEAWTKVSEAGRRASKLAMGVAQYIDGADVALHGMDLLYFQEAMTDLLRRARGI